MNNNIDISLTLGTRADMSGINQVRKGVDDLSTAARGLPRELISGGVGTVADARAFSGASAPGKMTIQVEGLDHLAGTIAARKEWRPAERPPRDGRTRPWKKCSPELPGCPKPWKRWPAGLLPRIIPPFLSPPPGKAGMNG